MDPDEDQAAGAIDTSDDNSGAAPVTPLPQSSAQPGAIETPVEDDSGTSPPAQAQAAPQQPPEQNGPGGSPPSGPLAGIGRKIVSYLMGDGAAHPDTLEQIAKQVDPEGKLPPADRNLLAFDKIRDTKGDSAAWSILQANRVAYNAQTAFAKTALTGTQQKPADIGAAIDAANKAQANVLDGSNVSFAHHGSGVTATVNMHGTTQPQVIQLSPQAFASWLDVGGDGQWDKVVQNSAPATLQKLSQQYPAQQTGAATVGAPAQARQARPAAAPQPAPQPAPQGGGDDDNEAPAAPQAPQQAAQAAPPRQAQARDVTAGDQPALPGTHDAQGHSLQGNKQPDTNYGEELEARADKMFGPAGNTATTKEREQWMSAQEQESEKLKNNVEVATEKGNKANERARITGSSRNEGESIKAGAKMEAAKTYSAGRQAAAMAKIAQEQAREEAINGRSNKSIAMAALRTKVGTGSKLTPQEQAYWDSTIQATPEPAQRPQSGAQRPQSGASPGQPPVQGARFYQGKWYTRGANGEAVPVQ